MRKQDDSLARLRKQEISAALAGVLFILGGAIASDRTWFTVPLERGLLAFGLACLAWAFWRTFYRRRPEAGAHRQGVLSEAFFVEHKRTLVSGLFCVHVLATLFFFSPADIVNNRPVVTLDHTFHYYQARRANQVFLDSGRLHAYDPFFMAGFPSALFDLDVKSLEVFCALFPLSEVARAMKIYILLCYLSMVFTAYLGCRLLRMTERESILAVSLMLAFWHWGRPYAAHFRYAGMFDFICVSHLSILVVGLFRRFLEGRNVLWWMLVSPIAYFIHPTAVVVLAAPYVSLIVFKHRDVTLRTLLLFVLWCLVVIVVNSIWIVPLFEYVSAKTATKTFFQVSGLPSLCRVVFMPGCLPAAVLGALAVPGAWRLARGGRKTEAGTLSITLAFLVFITAYGVFIPGIDQLEPGRFLLTAVFLSAPLAGAGAAAVLDVWSRLAGRRTAWAALGGAAFIALVLSPIVLSYLSARTGYRHRLKTEFAPEVRDLVAAVQKHTDRSGRLMIEDGPAALYGDAHLPGILPAYTGVEQIGGPYPFTFIAHHFATFEKKQTMGKPLSELASSEFWGYADLYNIRWIAAASDEAKEFVRRVASDTESVPTAWRRQGTPPLAPVWQAGRYELWRVERPATFTGIEGDRVTASLNRIRIDLAELRESFVLRYHWDRGFEVSAPAKVTPVYELNDPIPFMRIEPNGARSMVIEY